MYSRASRTPLSSPLHMQGMETRYPDANELEEVQWSRDRDGCTLSNENLGLAVRGVLGGFHA